MPDATRISLATPLSLTATSNRRKYTARLVRAGRIRYADNSPGPITIPPDVLQSAVSADQFVGIPCFLDHAATFDNPSLRDLAAVVTHAAWNPTDEAVDATLTLYLNPAGEIVRDLFDQVLRDQAEGVPMPDVGLSLVFWPEWASQPDDVGAGAPACLTLAAFRHIESCDFVFQPAADGRIKAALAAPIPERSLTMPPEPIDTTPPAPAAPPAPPAAAVEWLDALRTSTIDAMINTSGLPSTAQDQLRGRYFTSAADVQQAIDHTRELVATLTADQVVQIGKFPPRGPVASGMRTGLDQVQLAVEAMLGGTRPPSGVQPLSGLRELYHLLSGDFEMQGVFQPDRIYLANVNSSTMAGLVANALNKVVMNLFATYPAWWAPIVSELDFANLQDIRWISLGGIGELPTVPEGGAYTELTWDDQTETSSFVKKGGYLGITLETIDKDDTGRVAAAPRALAQAAWLTLSKAIAAIFTVNSGTGPTMSDSRALFHNNHANLCTSALSWTSYAATRVAMMKQTDLNSGERLGALTRPYYVLVPIDLEITALQVLASEGEPGVADNDVNPLAAGDSHDSRLSFARQRVVVVPLWTDTSRWAACADPRLHPTIGLGYRYGRTPQIFSVASPTAGLMFTNDTMPIKVRFFYATGPVDWRGLYKHNV
jgi:hypothetical protein